jgi:hypothetical protein
MAPCQLSRQCLDKWEFESVQIRPTKTHWLHVLGNESVAAHFGGVELLKLYLEKF